jgi:hypothetical protein
MPSKDTPPPLTEAEVADAERELGVAFPAEYRAYLVGVSAGGAVSRLARTERGWWWENNHDTLPELLAAPFPHPDSYAEADDELVSDEFEDQKTAGSIVIEEHGCGFATLLALSGPLAGTVWWDGRATCDRIVPLSLDHPRGARPVTFGEWLGRSSWDLLPPGWG